MTAFALGREVHDLPAPEDHAAGTETQTYIEDFATPATHVLTHTFQSAIGMTTRSGAP